MNYILNIVYNGKFFNGSQSQLNFNTINDFFLYFFYKYKKKLYKFIFSSRTDVLVNSLNQIINCYNFNFISKIQFLKLMNKKFINYLYIFSIKQTSSWFHSIYSSLYRIYCYIFNFHLKFIYNFIDFNFYINYKLNLYKFLIFIKHIIGFKNFFIFDKVKFLYLKTFRIFYEFNFYKIGNYIYILFKSNSFLYNMVRNILSFLIYINYLNFKKFWYILKIFYLNYIKLWIKPFDSNNLFLIKIKYPFNDIK